MLIAICSKPTAATSNSATFANVANTMFRACTQFHSTFLALGGIGIRVMTFTEQEDHQQNGDENALAFFRCNTGLGLKMRDAVYVMT